MRGQYHISVISTIARLKEKRMSWHEYKCKNKLGNKLNQIFLGMLNENESSLIHRPVYFIFLTPLVFKRFMNVIVEIVPLNYIFFRNWIFCLKSRTAWEWAFRDLHVFNVSTRNILYKCFIFWTKWLTFHRCEVILEIQA